MGNTFRCIHTFFWVQPVICPSCRRCHKVISADTAARSITFLGFTRCPSNRRRQTVISASIPG